MTDKRHVTEHDLTQLESGLKQILDASLNAQGVFASVITESGDAQTLFLGDNEAANAIATLLIRYVADSQEVNVFEKILEIQTKLMHLHPEEFNTYAESMQKRLSQHHKEEN